MTLNWGHKLIFVFLVFGGMMSYLVYRSVMTNFDLVSKEYYKDELAYQQVIEGTRRANLLSARATITQENDSVIISLPGEMKHAAIDGTLWFYCASDATRDIKLPLLVNESAIQKIPSKLFTTGTYTVKISWQKLEQFYYSEQTVTIQ